MNAVVTSLDRYQPSHSNAFQSPLSGEALRERAPAVFAAGAHERTSPSYTFISTQDVLGALASAGFLPVEARQAARARSPMHARHLIRLRRRAETVRLRDSLPELLFLNSHDGTSAYLMLIFACHHRRDSTCYPAYWQLNPRRGAMVTFSEEQTVPNWRRSALRRTASFGRAPNRFSIHSLRRQTAPSASIRAPNR